MEKKNDGVNSYKTSWRTLVWPVKCVRHLRAFEFDRFLLLERQTASKELAKHSCVQNLVLVCATPHCMYVCMCICFNWGSFEESLIKTNNLQEPRAIEKKTLWRYHKIFYALNRFSTRQRAVKWIKDFWTPHLAMHFFRIFYTRFFSSKRVKGTKVIRITSRVHLAMSVSVEISGTTKASEVMHILYLVYC